MSISVTRSLFRGVHRYSWISLLVCWLIWILNAYDREIILRLGPTISSQYSLSPEVWGSIVSVVMLALALLDIPGSIWSDRYGAGWKRARFQVPLVLGYTALSFLSGFKSVSGRLTNFVLLRIGVNLGAGWGEPVGVSNTTEWWPRELRGFALGAHHTGYPIGALLSGVVAGAVLATFGQSEWRYAFLLSFVLALPLMLFWAHYSTHDKVEVLYKDIATKGMTPPILAVTPTTEHNVKEMLRACFGNRNIMLVAGTTLLTQVVYMGINVVLPPYLHNVFGLSFAASAGMSVVFTVTGILGQLVWPSLSDVIGRKTTLVICGLWMAASVGAFYFANSMHLIILVQLLFGLVANAVWPIYYAAASDAAPPASTSTSNGIVTTAMFIGGGLAPALMGELIAAGGGWTAIHGYTLCFFTMAASALAGVLLQLLAKVPDGASPDFKPEQ